MVWDSWHHETSLCCIELLLVALAIWVPTPMGPPGLRLPSMETSCGTASSSREPVTVLCAAPQGAPLTVRRRIAPARCSSCVPVWCLTYYPKSVRLQPSLWHKP